MHTVEAVAFAAFALLALVALTSAKLLDDRERRLAAAAVASKPKSGDFVPPPHGERGRESSVHAHERVSRPSGPPS